MPAEELLHVLIVERSHDEANRFVSILRSADYKVDAKLATTEDELQRYISVRNWDLLFAPLDFQSVLPATIFRLIRRSERDIPVIFINEVYDAQKLIEALRLGAEDVVIKDQDQHFLLVTARALSSVKERRQAREWERKLSITEKRSEHLMDLSRHPIAIIQEGTFAYANESCATYFGYSDPDDMLCLPVLDHISKNDQAKLKAYMVPLDQHSELMPFEAVLKTQTLENQIEDAFIEISQIQFKGEPALQLTVDKDKLFNANIEQSVQQADVEYSAIQPNLVFEMVSRGINQAAQSGRDCMMLNVQIDRFNHLKEDLGIAKTEKVAHSVVTFIVKTFSHNLECARLSENSFIMLLADTAPDKGVEVAESLTHHISHDVFNVDSESFSLSASIGVTALNESVPSVERAIERSETAIQQLRNGKEIGNGAKLYIPDIQSEEVSETEAVSITANRFLKEGLFSIHYQPIVALVSGDNNKDYYEVILGVNTEVPAHEIPKDFIANLFKSDMAGEVDRWVMLEAMKALSAKLVTHPQTQLFINISAESFGDDQFLPWLKTALKASALPVNALIFQIREIDAARHIKKAAKIASEMKKVNGQIGISNFGLAINPLKTLEHVPADFIKLDQVIVKRLEQDSENRAEFEKIVGGLTGSETKVVVPFIEQPSIIPILWQQGVQFIQGHYVKAPSPRMDFDFDD